MAADPLSPVARGQVLAISAAAWNEVLATARDHRTPRRPDRPVRPRQAYGVVEALALNSTGSALREFKPAAVTAAGGYDVTGDAGFDWQRKPLLTLGVPTGPADHVVVTLEAIPAGEIGRVAVAGAVLCDVHVNDAGHGFAAPTTNTTALESAATGPVRILHKGTGSSTRRCAVYLFSPGGPDLSPYPLNPLPCLVADGYGAAAGLAQIWYDPADGTAECRTSGFCGCPPADPPSPETSCCSLWYCTPNGPVEVEADADGVYTPPEGWDGSEPHLTEATALAACPLPPVPFDCPGSTEPAEFPAVVYLTAANPTGGFVGLFPDNTIAVPISSTGGGANAYGAVVWADANGKNWSVAVLANCVDGAFGPCIGGGNDRISIQVDFWLQTLTDYGCASRSFTPTAPWVTAVAGTTFGVCRAKADEYIAPGGEQVGTLNYSCSGLTGTIDVFVST